MSVFFGCVQTEIAKLRELLAASEKQLDEECHKRMELSQQVSKLTEMRELFQLQMDTAGYIGSAAEKKVQWHCRSHELWPETTDTITEVELAELQLVTSFLLSFL